MKRLVLVAVVAFMGNEMSAAIMKLQVHVVDAETGNPVSGAEIGVGFRSPPSMWGGESHTVHRDGVTGKDGICSFTGRSSSGRCGWTVRVPDKYYNGYGRWELNDSNHGLPLVPHSHSMTVALHRVKSPIPLYINQVERKFGKDMFGETDVIQYDLLKGDWMPPKGTGEVADIEFIRYPHKKLASGTNGVVAVDMRLRNRMTVKFLGEDCGIITVQPSLDSYLKWRTAPKTGYERECVCEYSMGEGLQSMCSWGENICQCFRIRVRKDADGTIKEAYYGKIYNGIELFFAYAPFVRVSGFEFTYYLNLTSQDRNLEYDQKHNLNPKMRNNYQFAP